MMNLDVVKRLIESGATQRAIAEQFCTNYGVVGRFLRRHGLKTQYQIEHAEIIAAQTAKRMETKELGLTEKPISYRQLQPCEWGIFEDVGQDLLRAEEGHGWLRMAPKPDYGGYMSPLCSK